MVESSNPEMASRRPLSEELVDALSQILSYQMHISHVYLGMAYSFTEKRNKPPFAKFFENQANMRREHADEFLRCLWKCENKIRPQSHEKPDMKEITTPIRAIKLAQEMENTLTKMLLHINNKAEECHEEELLNILKPFMQKQKRNEDYLKCQLNYQEREEKKKQSSAHPEDQPFTTSGGRVLRRRVKKPVGDHKVSEVM